MTRWDLDLCRVPGPRYNQFMRIIEVCKSPVRALGVSPDGRFVAASTDRVLGVFHWTSGDPVLHGEAAGKYTQFAFAPDGSWVAPGLPNTPLTLEFVRTGKTVCLMTGTHAGGVAVSPDGKKLVAVQNTGADKGKLVVWDLPGLRPRSGYDGWSGWPPFSRLAFSRNGEFLAGIWPGVRHQWSAASGKFEVRFARTGGGDYKYPPMSRVFGAPGFVSFTHDSSTCAFGWSSEFHILDLSTGTARELKYIQAPFRDAAFTGSGRHFATVEDTGVLKLWDVHTWEVVQEYVWQCGPLTCVAFTADGTAGVCGTTDGRLVQFDVDE
jgi:WD40 repeat protein